MRISLHSILYTAKIHSGILIESNLSLIKKKIDPGTYNKKRLCRERSFERIDNFFRNLEGSLQDVVGDARPK